MTAVVCVALVCGCALAGWILYLRTLPLMTRAEAETLRAEMKTIKAKVDIAQAGAAFVRRVGG